MDEHINDKQITDKQITDKQITDKQITDKQITDIQLTMKHIESLLVILQINQNQNTNNINKILDILQVSDIGNNCRKMGEHIQFVENVYSNIKQPMNYICNKINVCSNIENKLN